MTARQAKAILTNKRIARLPGFPSPVYVVDATCSDCGFRRKLAFAGWSAIVCPSCRAEMHRTPYRGAR